MKITLKLNYMLFVIIIMMMITGCPTESDSNDKNPTVLKETLRYETEPFVRNSTARSEQPVLHDKLVYYAKCNDYFYYVFLLGNINYVPIAYRSAIEYNGITPIEIAYSITNATEESVTKAMEVAIENSTSSSKSFNASVSVKKEFKSFLGGISVGFTAGTNLQWDTSQTRSTSNTLETMVSNLVQETDEIRATIGNNDEPPGLYRYSYFGTTDVYYVLITDHSYNLEEQYFAVLARPQMRWAIDYEPDLNGDFGKTAGGELLTIPELELSELPEPKEDLEQYRLPSETPVVTPVFSPASGTRNGPTNVTLSTTTPDAVIYYTIKEYTDSEDVTDPPDPTTSSYRYINPIQLTQNKEQTTYIIKARAFHDLMLPSAVTTVTYTMSPEALMTSWTAPSTQLAKSVTITGTERKFLTSGFDIEALRAAGYTHFKVNITFKTAFSGINLAVLKIQLGHTTDAENPKPIINESMNASKTYTFTSGQILLDEFTDNRLTVTTVMLAGSLILTYRVVKVTAYK